MWNRTTVAVWTLAALGSSVVGLSFATQAMADALGYADVLGAPVVNVSHHSLGPVTLLHMGFALGGAGAALWLRTNQRRLGCALLGAATVAGWGAAGPLYLPTNAVVWGRLMAASDGTLSEVLWTSVAVGVGGAAWAGLLATLALRERAHAKQRWSRGYAARPHDVPAPQASRPSGAAGGERGARVAAAREEEPPAGERALDLEEDRRPGADEAQPNGAQRPAAPQPEIDTASYERAVLPPPIDAGDEGPSEKTRAAFSQLQQTHSTEASEEALDMKHHRAHEERSAKRTFRLNPDEDLEPGYP